MPWPHCRRRDISPSFLAHRPERYQDYAPLSCDLIVNGHAHGGQWRIPGLLNGLYAPNQGLFPDHAGGRYFRDEGQVQIVSRGLARESTFVPGSGTGRRWSSWTLSPPERAPDRPPPRHIPPPIPEYQSKFHSFIKF